MVMESSMPLPRDPNTRAVLEREADQWWSNLSLNSKLLAYRMMDTDAHEPVVEAVVYRHGLRFSGPDAFAKAMDCRDPDPADPVEAITDQLVPIGVIQDASDPEHGQQLFRLDGEMVAVFVEEVADYLGLESGMRRDWLHDSLTFRVMSARDAQT